MNEPKKEVIKKQVPKKSLHFVNILKIGILSTANTLGLFNFFISILIGIILSTIATFFYVTIQLKTPYILPGLGTIWLLMVIVFPVVNLILSWITGAIIAMIYNLSSKISKGIVLYS